MHIMFLFLQYKSAVFFSSKSRNKTIIKNQCAYLTIINNNTGQAHSILITVMQKKKTSTDIFLTVNC